MNTGRRDSPASFCAFQKPASSKNFGCLAGTWLLISPEPPNPLRLFFPSVLIIKDWFVVIEKCPKEPKRSQAAFRWGGQEEEKAPTPLEM